MPRKRRRPTLRELRNSMEKTTSIDSHINLSIIKTPTKELCKSCEKYEKRPGKEWCCKLCPKVKNGHYIDCTRWNESKWPGMAIKGTFKVID